MIPITVLRILFLLIIPIAIFSLVKGIKFLGRTFNGKLIAEVPYVEKTGVFDIPESGNYSIWQKGKMLSRTPVDKFKPVNE